VAKKSDGIRYNLLLGTHANKRPYAVLINRALEIYQIQVFAPRCYFEGSLFDGELVWHREHHCLIYLVFDVVSSCKDRIGKRNLLERYDAISRIFPQECDWDRQSLTDHPIKKAQQLAESGKIVCVPDVENLLFIYSKPSVRTNALDAIVRSLPDCNHDNDGLIFTPIDEPIRKNRHDSMFKWKFTPSVDLRYVALGSGLYQLWCMDGDREVLITDAIQDWNFQIDTIDLDSYAIGGKHIIEMNVVLNEQTKTITCKRHRIRTDKPSPNDIRTILAIIREIKESITLDELQKCLST